MFLKKKIELIHLPVMDNNVFSAIAIQRLYNYYMRKTPLYGSQALLEEIQLQHIVGGEWGRGETVPHNFPYKLDLQSLIWLLL